jgi:excinuclease ABC subunit B
LDVLAQEIKNLLLFAVNNNWHIYRIRRRKPKCQVCVILLGMKFALKSEYKPTGDQPKAIEALWKGLESGEKHQVLLGVTGSGKTFTVANLIQKLNWPVLVISHNKTLAAQLYQEFRDYFPDNAISYFVSYYDYYQPEAYIPTTDTYIEKETEINELIDKLRLQATTNLLTRSDSLIVASVSCIYNIGSPKEYGNYVLEVKIKEEIKRKDIFGQLNKLCYGRSDMEFKRGTYRVRGENIDIYPAYDDFGIRIETLGDKIIKISKFDPLLGTTLEHEGNLEAIIVYPAKHYMVDTTDLKNIFANIRSDLKIQLKKLKENHKDVEAYRLERKVNYDLEMIEETGYVNGIENYSRYFDKRKPGDPPYTLLNYYQEKYGDKWLLIIDESHMTIPQINGMYNGDRSRKQTLIDYGFRLPSCLDNRPLKFDEFLRQLPQVIYTSATPSKWELSISDDKPVEQLIRPTGLADPVISVRPSANQINDLIKEIKKRVVLKQRVLVTTLTKRMAEELANYLKDQDINVHYLHSDIQTLDRSDIIDDLRSGKYDVLVGINLLREGLDLPEVSLVAILDADKEGFLRSQTSLVQVMGRAARHLDGQVIMYADNITHSMSEAISEVERRRKIQLEYNRINKIVPQGISKPVRAKLIEREEIQEVEKLYDQVKVAKINELTPEDKTKTIKQLTKEMNLAAKELNFELAAKLRDILKKITKVTS